MHSPCQGHRVLPLPVKLPDGSLVKVRAWGWRRQPCPITDQSRYVPEMAARGLERVGIIGRSRVTLFKLQDCVNLVTELLGSGMDGFPPCRQCPNRPADNPRYVSSDWDNESGCLLPDSEAWDIEWLSLIHI